MRRSHDNLSIVKKRMSQSNDNANEYSVY